MQVSYSYPKISSRNTHNNYPKNNSFGFLLTKEEGSLLSLVAQKAPSVHAWIGRKIVESYGMKNTNAVSDLSDFYLYNILIKGCSIMKKESNDPKYVQLIKTYATKSKEMLQRINERKATRPDDFTIKSSTMIETTKVANTAPQTLAVA